MSADPYKRAINEHINMLIKKTSLSKNSGNTLHEDQTFVGLFCFVMYL